MISIAFIPYFCRRQTTLLHWKRSEYHYCFITASPSLISSPQLHYSDVLMGTMASLIIGVPIIYSTVCLGADQRKHQSSASLAFVREIHRWQVISPEKGPVTRKKFSFDGTIMIIVALSIFFVIVVSIVFMTVTIDYRVELTPFNICPAGHNHNSNVVLCASLKSLICE